MIARLQAHQTFSHWSTYQASRLRTEFQAIRAFVRELLFFEVPVVGLIMGGEGRGVAQFGDGGWRDEFKGIFRLGRWLCEKKKLKFIIVI